MPRPRTTLRMGSILNRGWQVFQFSRPAKWRRVKEACRRREKDCAKVWTWANVRLGAKALKAKAGGFVMRKMILAAVGTVLVSCGAYGQEAPSGTKPCEGLAQLELPGAKILSAQTVAAGAFTPPPNMSPWVVGDLSFYKTLGAFCRVVVEATRRADSPIKIEVWMPVNDHKGSGWNGKLQGQANGGFAGEIGYHWLGIAVQQD